MNPRTKQYRWESKLQAGDIVLARWSRVVFGTRYCHRAKARVTRICALDLSVKVLELSRSDPPCERQVRAGQVTIPRALQPRHGEDDRVEPWREPRGLDGLGIAPSPGEIAAVFREMTLAQRQVALLAARGASLGNPRVHAALASACHESAQDVLDAICLGLNYLATLEPSDLDIL